MAASSRETGVEDKYWARAGSKTKACGGEIPLFSCSRCMTNSRIPSILAGLLLSALPLFHTRLPGS